MNGFANTVLTMLLSWLKALVSNIWSVFTGENGDALYRFFASHWKTFFVVLCSVGLLVDGLIYLIRWRPYYVWFRRPRVPRPQENDAWQQDPYEPNPSEAYAPHAQDGYAQPAYARSPYSRPDDQQPAYREPADATRPYQRAASYGYAPAQSTALPFVQPEAGNDVEPLFDDEPLAWEDAVPSAAPQQSLVHDMPATFGAPQPEPLAYLRDMQAGFARPLPPEQLYAPAAQPDPTPAPEGPYAPVHPGLDADAFRQSFGLSQNEPVQQPIPVMRAPAFHPFTMQNTNTEDAKGQHPLARFAKRARDLVGVDDESRRPTIRDLQSTVDISTAFHEPVYPQPRNHEGGEE